MNIHAAYPTTPDEFLRWNEGREGKREFIGGRVVELMINTTRKHARIAADLVVALRTRLDRAGWDVGSADFGVRTPLGIRYPDVYVDRIQQEAKDSDLAATAPVLLAEVLSDSSHRRDLVEKLADYQGIPSLRHYLVLSQVEPHVWLWSRDETGWSDAVEVHDPAGTLDLSALGLSVALHEIYR